MSLNLKVSTSELKDNVTDYAQLEATLKNCIQSLENIKANLDCHSYGAIKNVLGAIIEKQRDYANKAGDMGEVLANIIHYYEETERRIASLSGEGSSLEDGVEALVEDVIPNIEDYINEIIAMLKGFQPESCSYGGDPINFATGNFIYHREFLKTKGLFPMHLELFYNSMEQRDGVVGKGWVHNYQVYIQFEGERTILTWTDGREDIYLKGKSEKYRNIITKKEDLTETEEGFEYETTLGVRYFFDKVGKNTGIIDTNHNQLILVYDDINRLMEVKSCSGERLCFTYNATDLLAEVRDHSGRCVQLEYREGRLSQITDECNAVFRYSYDDKGNLSGVTNGRNIQTIYNEYDNVGRVIRQAYPDGGEIRLNYDDSDKVVRVTEQNGNRVDYVHDDRMRSVETVFADGKIKYTYNDKNQRTCVTDKRGNKTRYSYDAAGNLCKVINPLGEKVEMTYNSHKKIESIKICGEQIQKNKFDEKGNLICRRDAIGREIGVSYNASGRPVEIRQPDGSVIQLSYDSHGNIITVREPMGGETHYEYNLLGQVVSTTDGNGNRTEYKYNNRGFITEVTNAEGNTKCFTYNESSKVVCIRDFDGSTIFREYNAINKISKITNQEGNSITFEYDKMYNVSRRVEANGAETRFVYNKLNRLERMINTQGAEMVYEYDANGNRTQILDSEGGVTRFEYDALNRLIAVEDADGSYSRVEYNQFGQKTKLIDAIGSERRYIYDKAGQKIASIDAKGNETKFYYNKLGRLSEVIDSEGRKTTYDYLQGGLLEQITYPDGTFVCYTYDKNRNVKSKSNQDGYTFVYTYDCMNRVTRIESNEGQVKTYTYDAVGRVKTVTNANNATTEYLYSPTGKLVAVIDPMGNRTEYCYDEIGGLTDIYQCNMEEWDVITELNEQNSKRHFIHYDRNIFGQVEKITDALGHTEQYTYNKVGRLIEKTDKDGLVTKYDYTAGGQLSEIQYEDGESVKFSYNALKQLVEIKDWLGVTTFDVDVLGRVEKVTDYEGREVSYTRGKLGQRLSMKYPGGKVVEYGYDEFMRLTSLKDEEGEFKYSYDKGGRLLEKLMPNGVRTNYAYFTTGALASLSHYDEDGLIDQIEYQYDLNGNKVRMDKIRRGVLEDTGIFDYAYDASNRLISVKKDNALIREYGYDAFGNRSFMESEGERTDYYYNQANQMIRCMNGDNITDYAYDNRGNLTEIIENGVLMHNYEFNSRNKMSKAVSNDGLMAFYEYNGLGHRVSKQISKMDEVSVADFEMLSSKEFLQDLNHIEYLLDYTKGYHNLLEKHDNNGLRQYLWDNGVAAERGVDGAVYYLKDERGSLLHSIDAAGEITGQYHFDEFGNDLCKSFTQDEWFGYAGFMKDNVSNTYFVQAREYFPVIGRFASCDVMKGFVGAPYTLNEYNYCWNRPLDFVDYNGEWPSWSDIKNGFKDICDSAGKFVGEIANEVGETISEGVTTIFNGAEYLWDTYVPAEVQDFVSDAGTWVLENARKVLEVDIIGDISISDVMAYATQTWWGEAFLDAVNFERTEDGVYHASPDCWQKPFGYNGLYDYVFDGFTDMDVQKLSFSTGDGTEYTIWMWKGDYYNLGAGCETGIYYGKEGDYHVNALEDSNLIMELSLYGPNGEKIFVYKPTDPQWWITGFNPRYQDYKADDLEVRGSIDFSEHPEMWDAFYDKYKYTEGWCFDEENQTAYYRW